MDSYGYISVQGLQFCNLGYLGFFVIGKWFFALFTFFCTLATYQFSIYRNYKTFICDYNNLFQVFYLLLPYFWRRLQAQIDAGQWRTLLIELIEPTKSWYLLPELLLDPMEEFIHALV